MSDFDSQGLVSDIEGSIFGVEARDDLTRCRTVFQFLYLI